jgi:ssDNA thymidine ADP-ribosyltransferase, DarT
MSWYKRMSQLDAKNAYIFCLTHIGNVAWILQHGLHCRSSAVKDPNFVPIGLAELIQKRDSCKVPISPGGSFSDYVPFYFTSRSIMHYNIHTGYNGLKKMPKADLAFVVSSLPRVAELGIPFVFTNGHAFTQDTDFYNDLTNLDVIDWALLRAGDFRRSEDDPSKLQRYQAEAMVHRHLPVEAILGIACSGDGPLAHLRSLPTPKSATVKLQALPNWYF